MPIQSYVNSLLVASLVIATLAMDQQDQEVDRVEVSDRRIEARRETPREGHDEVTPVKDSSLAMMQETC